MTDEQRVAHLMIKRVEVIAIYPNCPFEVGQVLTFSSGYPRLGDIYTDGVNGDMEYVPANDVEKSAANFRVLSWWENRTVDEMPEYVKYENSIEIFKVARWGHMQFDIYSNIEAGKINDFVWLDKFQPVPATHAEYLTYQQSKK